MTRRVLLLPMLLLAGCSWTVHAKDPATIDAIAATAANRAKDHERARKALERAASEAPTPAAKEAYVLVLNELVALEKAEQVRLANWRWREEQKEDER